MVNTRASKANTFRKGAPPLGYLWEGLHNQRIGGLDLRENIFWFAHPVYFAKTVFESGVLDTRFNPYEGHRITRTWVGIADSEKVFEVSNSPGFAPFGGPAANPTFNQYATPNSHFNIDAASTIHAGVDFPGTWVSVTESAERATPIHSFIFGEVVGFGDQADSDPRSFGRYVVIKDNKNPRHFFLLAHLRRDSNFRKGILVYPGMTVAHVSNTGAVWTRQPNGTFGRVTQEQRNEGRGAHLHLQLIIADNEADVVNPNSGTLMANINRISHNPFNHSEQWRG